MSNKDRARPTERKVGERGFEKYRWSEVDHCYRAADPRIKAEPSVGLSVLALAVSLPRPYLAVHHFPIMLVVVGLHEENECFVTSLKFWVGQ